MKLITLLIYMCFTLNVHAQLKDSVAIKKRNNTLTLNVGGEGFYFGTTLAFEKSLLNTKYLHLGLGVAAGKTYGIFYNRICFPTYVNAKIGKKRHFVELNIGVNHLVDFNPNPKTKAERDSYLATRSASLIFSIDSFRPPYIPSYFISVNYVFKGNNGFVFKIGCTGSKTDLEFIYPPIYFIAPRLSIGYAF
jgi:hypothetical protein